MKIFLGTLIALTSTICFGAPQNKIPDDRLIEAEEILRYKTKEASDGFFVSDNLENDSLFSTKPNIEKTYKYLTSECVKLSTQTEKAVAYPLSWSYPKFYLPNRDQNELANYLTNRGIASPENATKAAKVIIYTGGGSIMNSNTNETKKILSNATGIPENLVGHSSKARPFICLVTKNGYDNSVAFSAGFIGKSNGDYLDKLYFYYAGNEYFEDSNNKSLAYHGTPNYFGNKIEEVEQYYKEKNNKIVGYRYENPKGLINAITLSFDYPFSSININIHNNTKKPILLNANSFNTIKFEEDEYQILHTTHMGERIQPIRDGNCALNANENNIIINPKNRCSVSIGPIKIPGIYESDLPNKNAYIKVAGETIKLKPTKKGDQH